MLSLPIAFRSALGGFAPVFSRPGWPPVQVLMTGAALAPGQRTVTASLQGMGRSTAPDFPPSHRVLPRALWAPLTAPVGCSSGSLSPCASPTVSWSLALMIRANVDAARRSPPQASPALPCGPRRRKWAQLVAGAGARVWGGCPSPGLRASGRGPG